MPNIVFLPLITAFILTVFAAPLSLVFIRKLGILDDPNRKHPAILHKNPVPRAGGIPLFIGVIGASLIFLPITNMTIALFVTSFIALVIGVLDDKYDISPYIRFCFNILCAIIIVNNGVSIPFITNPFGGILHLDTIQTPFGILEQIGLNVGNLIAIVWLVWIVNMLNWSKGVDGQMPGIVAISAAVIGILSLRFPLSDPNTFVAATLSFIITGSSLGFLLFNFYPAKIFPGYGATSVYLLLGTVSILSGSKLATAMLVMGVPMIDGAMTIARRIITGHSPFRHDNKHLHHLLLQLGFGQRKIALSYWMLSAILGMIALSLESRGKLFAITMIVLVIGGGILFLHFILRENNEKKNI